MGLRKYFFLGGCCFCAALWGYEGYLESNQEKPWFTGPLISTSGNLLVQGQWNIEPYLFAYARSAFYDNDWKVQSIETLWNVQWRVPIWVGVSDWVNVKAVPVWSWNQRGHSSCWTVNDMILELSFQLYRDQLPHPNFLPSMKVFVRETFPTGRYQKLKFDKKGTDGGGQGAWMTTFGFCASRVFDDLGGHYLNLDLNCLYSISTNVPVKGLNFYGGGEGTDGVVSPGSVFQFNGGAEFTLTRNWALACDLVAIFTGSSPFKGDPGVLINADGNIDPNGVPAQNNLLPAVQWSVAPAIEYNWSDHLGVIFGAWLTVAGKNASRFNTAVAAVDWMF